jgi:dipeptidyl-peptidase-3
VVSPPIFQQFSEFESIVLKFDDDVAKELWVKCADKIFSLAPNEKELALPPNGISTYYSPNITKDDVDFVQDYLNENKICPENTRLWKLSDDVYELRYAAIKPITGEVARQSFFSII